MTKVHAVRNRGRAPAVPSDVKTDEPALRVFNPTPESEFSFRNPGESWERRAEYGRSLRQTTPRESHADWTSVKGRPDPVATLLASNAGRQEHLLPLRHGRMVTSPFGFLRGAAAVMAWDLSHTPSIGLPVVICGDAHLNNFGFYGTPQGEVVFDINDFDETTIGPWEWDLKRLTASVNVLGRENGLNKRERRVAVMLCAAGYRLQMQRVQSMGVLDLWYLHTKADRFDVAPILRAYPPAAKLWPKAQAVMAKAAAKARKTDNTMLLRKTADRGVDGGWRFKEDPPLLTPVEPETREKVIDALDGYWTSVAGERRFMLRRYHVADVAHRVVGVGSVGTRAYVALLFGNSDQDPLFLQVKEATAPAHAPYLPPASPFLAHHGFRVVAGQTALQAAHDPLLGYTKMDGRDYYVRQMKNMKGALPMSVLSGAPFEFFALGFGGLLARAHARAGDAAVIAGYCGNSPILDAALAEWAESYGEQTLKDHAALQRAIKSERLPALHGV
jgi:uncharacterized protein (DUF2252 family)